MGQMKDMGTALALGDIVRMRVGPNASRSGVVVNIVTDNHVDVDWGGKSYLSSRVTRESTYMLTKLGAQCSACETKFLTTSSFLAALMGCLCGGVLGSFVCFLMTVSK